MQPTGILGFNFAHILEARLEFRLRLLKLGKGTAQVIQFLVMRKCRFQNRPSGLWRTENSLLLAAVGHQQAVGCPSQQR